MRVNSKKTQLLCVSADRSSQIVTHIVTDQGRIESTDRLKILGFVFSDKPGVHGHCEYIEEKFAQKIWILRALRSASWDSNSILRAYTCILRPVIEYASILYHSLLNETQKENLERMQRRALRIIYGWSKSYEELIEESGIETLERRRVKATEKFAKKIETNPRFAEKWLKAD